MGFPEGTKKIQMQLRLPDLRARIIRELEDCVDLIQREPERLRYRHHSPQKILAEVNDLTAYREPLKASDEPSQAEGYFVTQDQIDAIGQEIAMRPEVSSFNYVSAEEAWEEYKLEYFDGDEAAAASFWYR